MSNIKLGITLYSFSNEYIHNTYSVEEILRKASEMGYKGVEFIPAQMAPTYPVLTDEWLAELKALIEKYNMKPVCWSAYIDLGMVTGRVLTEEEIIHYTVNDLIYAKKAGFPMVRTQYSISPDTFAKMVPYCKKLDMKLAIEMHHPHHPDVPLWKEYFEIMREKGEGYLGVVPDFGIFIRRPHKLWIDQALEMGIDENTLYEIIEAHQMGAPLEEVRKGLNERDAEIVEDLYENFTPRATPEQLRDFMDIVFYMHGKFFYVEEGKNDECIPYEKILRVVDELGYDGYITCEYEGHHFTDEISSAEQLERYVAMCRRILGK